jgi:phenylpyruvate tautomerase PptA (4-oxalocrotonate tautomerase family)
MNENNIEPTTGNLGKKVLIKDITDNIEKVKSVSSIYQKIYNETRYKIVVIVIEENHYEDI